jgi:hypothetical protein
MVMNYMPYAVLTEENVVKAILSGVNTNTKMQTHFKRDRRAVENVLRRLKSKGFVGFSKGTKTWFITNASRPLAAANAPNAPAGALQSTGSTRMVVLLDSSRARNRILPRGAKVAYLG